MHLPVKGLNRRIWVIHDQQSPYENMYEMLAAGIIGGSIMCGRTPF